MAKFVNRVKTRYSAIPRELIEDKELSLQARMLYCILAVKPDDWEYFTKPLMQQMSISDERTFRRYRNELITRGWLLQYTQARKDGKFGAPVYELMESITDVQKMHNGNPTDVQNLPDGENCRTAQNAQQLNTNLINNTNSSTIHTHTPGACEEKEKTVEEKNWEITINTGKACYPNLAHMQGWNVPNVKAMLKRCNGDWTTMKMILAQMNNKPDLMAQRVDLYTTFVSFLDNNKMKPL